MTYLPYTYRNKLSAESQEYKDIIKEEIYSRKKLQESENGSQENLETLIRLEAICYGINFSSDNFKIDQFSSYDKQTIRFNKWQKKEAQSKHILIYLNGLESHAGWFSEVANELAKRGITIYGLDRRGSGLNSRNIGKWQDWVDDVDKIVEIAKNENQEVKIYLTSLCFGAKIATAYAIQNPEKINSLIYFSPGINVKVDPTPYEKLIIGLSLLGLPFNIPSPIRKDSMFTDSKEALDFLHRDKLRTSSPRARDVFEAKKINSYILKNLEKITTPSLVLLAEKDQVVDNEATKKTLQKFGKKPEIIQYMDSEHTIFFGSSKNKLIEDIVNFIE